MNVSVPKESASGERRVALVPEVVERLAQKGVEVTVETGAGAEAHYPDDAYTEAGATPRRGLLGRGGGQGRASQRPRRSAGSGGARC